MKLERAEIFSLLQANSLQLQVGPLSLRLGSPSPLLANSLSVLYAAHPMAAISSDTVADIYAQIRPTSNLRRWWRPQYQFYRDGVCTFLPLPEHHVPAMLEWGMNYAIGSSCHQWLMLHGAMLARGEDALIMPAPSGSGKSTLTAALVCQGWRLLSDEFVIIDPQTGLLLPLPRPISLKNQAITVMRGFSDQVQIPFEIEGTNKGTIGLMCPPKLSVLQQQRTARPVMIVQPHWQANSQLKAEQLPPGQSLMLLADNAFNYPLWQERGFHLLGDLVESAAGFKLSYQHLDQAIDWIESQFAKQVAIKTAPTLTDTPRRSHHASTADYTTA